MKVDGIFAANGRIDHRKKRCRHMDELDAAQVERRCKACDISRNAASKRDDAVASSEFMRRQFLEKMGERLNIFVLFTSRKADARKLIGAVCRSS